MTTVGAPGWNRTSDTRFRKPAEGVTGSGRLWAIVLHDPSFSANAVCSCGQPCRTVKGRLVGIVSAVIDSAEASGDSNLFRGQASKKLDTVQLLLFAAAPGNFLRRSRDRRPRCFGEPPPVTPCDHHRSLGVPFRHLINAC